MGIKENWHNLKAWYSDNLPEVLDSLNPGASEKALNKIDEELRQEIGQGLPAELRELYLQNDGQNEDASCGVWFGLHFISLEEVRREWQDWAQIARDIDHSDEPPEYSWKAIRHVYANAYWIPFVHDGGGNHIGVDLQPEPEGQVGQIINFGADEEYRYVLAPSLGDFIAWLVNQYEKGNYRTIPRKRGDKMRCIAPLNPPKEHFLDAVPTLFNNKKGQLPS